MEKVIVMKMESKKGCNSKENIGVKKYIKPANKGMLDVLCDGMSCTTDSLLPEEDIALKKYLIGQNFINKEVKLLESSDHYATRFLIKGSGEGNVYFEQDPINSYLPSLRIDVRGKLGKKSVERIAFIADRAGLNAEELFLNLTLTRVDIAVDIYTKPEDLLIYNTRAHNNDYYIDNSKRSTQYLGSKYSGNQIKLYDKSKQLKEVKGVICTHPYSRIEFRTRPKKNGKYLNVFALENLAMDLIDRFKIYDRNFIDMKSIKQIKYGDKFLEIFNDKDFQTAIKSVNYYTRKKILNVIEANEYQKDLNYKIYNKTLKYFLSLFRPFYTVDINGMEAENDIIPS